jgi:cyanophycinase
MLPQVLFPLAFFLLPVGAAPGAERAAKTVPAPQPAGLAGGALVIVGGGLLPDVVRDRFLELAGGKSARLVVIPTASSRAEIPGGSKSYAYWKAQNVASVVELHTRMRQQADNTAFVKPLREATGVWMGGGDQSKLVAVYHGTAVEKELHKLLARGGVIGGTSAGASAMSAVMIEGGNPTAVVGTGLGLLPGVVIDQHFLNRNRLNRLLGVLAHHPSYLGVGIDEQTAVIVKGHTLTVEGNATVRVCFAAWGQQPPSVQVLKSGGKVDLLDLSQNLTARLNPPPPGKEATAGGVGPAPADKGGR